MKVIDEKGKIFGKINIIDMAIILIVIALFVGVGYKLFFQKSNGVSEQPTKKEKVEVSFVVKGCTPEIKDSIKKGDKLIVNNKLSDAEVTEVEVSNSKTTTVDEKGKLSVAENPLLVDIKIKVHVLADVSDAGATFNDEMMKVNADFILETMSFYANAKIIEVSLVE
ncbi:DUF4330 domain-containing protein [Faecalimonas sp.]